MRTDSSTPHKRRGLTAPVAFTLIELLVVLSVMAVLMADLHLEILATEEYDKVSETRRFWLPSDHPFGPPWDRMFQGMR